MILFKPYVDLSRKQVDEVWIYTMHVTILTNAPIVGTLDLYEAFSNTAMEGFFEVTIGVELEEASSSWTAAHVFPYSCKFELGEVSFGGSNPVVLKVKLFDTANSMNLGSGIVHQDDAEEEGMPGGKLD